MKYLSNIVEKEQIKSFIESNSEKIVNIVKTKFDVEDLYTKIIENMDNLISEDATEYYNNIKNYSLQYTLNFLYENSLSKKNLI